MKVDPPEILKTALLSAKLLLKLELLTVRFESSLTRRTPASLATILWKVEPVIVRLL